MDWKSLDTNKWEKGMFASNSSPILAQMPTTWPLHTHHKTAGTFDWSLSVPCSPILPSDIVWTNPLQLRDKFLFFFFFFFFRILFSLFGIHVSTTHNWNAHLHIQDPKWRKTVRILDCNSSVYSVWFLCVCVPQCLVWLQRVCVHCKTRGCHNSTGRIDRFFLLFFFYSEMFLGS